MNAPSGPLKSGEKKNSSRLAFYKAKEPVPELLARACIHWLTFWPAAAQQEFAGVNGIFTDWPCQSDSCYFWKMEYPLWCSDSMRHCRTSSSRKYQIKGFWRTTKCHLRVLRSKVSQSKKEEEKNNKNLGVTDGFHSCSLKPISHKEAQVMQAVSKREHVNNEKKVSVFITGREIKDSLLLLPAITVALINEALEPSSVGACFQLSILKAVLHLLRHKMQLSLSCYVSVRRPSPAFDRFLNRKAPRRWWKILSSSHWNTNIPSR